MEIMDIFIIISALVWSSAAAVVVIIDRRIKDLKEDQEEEFSSITYRINQIRSREIENQKMQEALDKLENENKKLKTKLRKSRKESRELKNKVIYLIGVTETMFGPEDI